MSRLIVVFVVRALPIFVTALNVHCYVVPHRVHCGHFALINVLSVAIEIPSDGVGNLV